MGDSPTGGSQVTGVPAHQWKTSFDGLRGADQAMEEVICKLDELSMNSDVTRDHLQSIGEAYSRLALTFERQELQQLKKEREALEAKLKDDNDQSEHEPERDPTFPLLGEKSAFEEFQEKPLLGHLLSDTLEDDMMPQFAPADEADPDKAFGEDFNDRTQNLCYVILWCNPLSPPHLEPGLTDAATVCLP